MYGTNTVETYLLDLFRFSGRSRAYECVGSDCLKRFIGSDYPTVKIPNTITLNTSDLIIESGNLIIGLHICVENNSFFCSTSLHYTFPEIFRLPTFLASVRTKNKSMNKRLTDCSAIFKFCPAYMKIWIAECSD